MKSPTLVVLAVLLFSCHGKSKPKEKPALSGNKPGFYQLAHPVFIALDSLHSVNAELADSINEKWKQSIDQYKEEIITSADTVTEDGLEVVLSADRQFCLVSWDSRLGGTEIENNAMAIYKTPDGQTVSKMLLDTAYDESELTLMHYDSVYTISSKKGTIYIALGFGQGSSALQWQELRAFQIENKYLLKPKLFPGKANTFPIEFDLQHFEGDTVPVIRSSHSGKQFFLPMQDEKAKSGYTYKTIVWKDSRYTFK